VAPIVCFRGVPLEEDLLIWLQPLFVSLLPESPLLVMPFGIFRTPRLFVPLGKHRWPLPPDLRKHRMISLHFFFFFIPYAPRPCSAYFFLHTPPSPLAPVSNNLQSSPTTALACGFFSNHLPLSSAASVFLSDASNFPTFPSFSREPTFCLSK